jgi:hypothetical protein
MATIHPTIEHLPAEGIATTWSLLRATALVESCCGVVALALPILALAHVLPLAACAGATLMIGIGLFLEGSVLVPRYRTLHTALQGRDWISFGSGMAIECAGGAIAIVLSAFALAGTNPLTLIELAVACEGATLFLGSGAVAELDGLGLSEAWVDPDIGPRPFHTLTGAAWLQVLIGLGAVVLAVIAMLNHWTTTETNLACAGALAMGGSLLASGLAVTAKAHRERLSLGGWA